jgi:hypothetical protein
MVTVWMVSHIVTKILKKFSIESFEFDKFKITKKNFKIYVCKYKETRIIVI